MSSFEEWKQNSPVYREVHTVVSDRLIQKIFEAGQGDLMKYKLALFYLIEQGKSESVISFQNSKFLNYLHIASVECEEKLVKHVNSANNRSGKLIEKDYQSGGGK